MKAAPGDPEHGPAGGAGQLERAIPQPRRPKAPPRPMPVRNGDFDHLTLDHLRAYRNALTAEEGRVSYWRRILQARLDVLREGRLTTVDARQLSPVLTNAGSMSGRTSLLSVMPADDIPPLPDLASLWARQVDHDSPATAESVERRLALEADLAAAEQELSEYRSSLHVRLGAATGELIARYRDEPALCLTVLPVRA